MQRWKRPWCEHNEKLLSFKMPCIVFCRSLDVSEEIKAMGVEYGVPIFQNSKDTSSFMAEVIRWLNVELAPESAYMECSSMYSEKGCLSWESLALVRVRQHLSL